MRASIPTAPRYIGASTWTSRIGSTPKRSGARSATTSTTVSSARSGLGRSMKKKSWSWSSPGSRCGRAALVDLVGGGGDHRARRLAEDLGEPDDRRDPRGDQVLERLAGADRRQLVGVADEDDVGRLGQAARAAPRSGAGSASRTRRRSPGRPAAGGPGLKAGLAARASTRACRWIVCASCPVASSSRRAARPVGAQRAIRSVGAFGLARRSPGCRRSCRRRGRRSAPRSATPKAPRTAAHCSSVSSVSLVAAASRRGRGRGGRGRRSAAARVCGDGELAVVGQLAVDAALVDRPGRGPRPAPRGRGRGRSASRCASSARPAAGSCCPAARPRASA